MHILFENIMKELLGLWEGDCKASMVTEDADGKLKEDYVVAKRDWDAMDREVSESNATVPAQMARRLGPILLKNRLSEVYYDHFVRLSQSTRIMTKVEITEEEVEVLTQGLVDWVKDFERLYYRYGSKYLSFCTNPIHALLHLPQYIRMLGSPCHYCCFSMLGFGGWVKRQVLHNRKSSIEASSDRVLRESRRVSVDDR
ncbi:hypothetical protein NCC49_004736 [Naganishia albida]|nr:hypothetical protein NCC49_004736 [Naganishia albida]